MVTLGGYLVTNDRRFTVFDDWPTLGGIASNFWGSNVQDEGVGGRLLKEVQVYGAWRDTVHRRVVECANWLEANELMDSSMSPKFERLLGQIGDDRLTIAVVGEFSRGKSELINAVFADGYGRRLLPAFPGRSTMCPTELRWDAAEPPSIRLLPIQTRAAEQSLLELRHHPDAWTVVPLDPADAQGLVDALAQISVTLRVPAAEARSYDLLAGQPGALRTSGDMVEIPRWRHAIINFPHPLLEQGLVILDTPGLNAIGSEPELTLSLLPNAQALLFVLALDTGLSETDVSVWRQHLAPTAGHEEGCFAVLNKIDTLWDGLRSEEEIALHVRRQVNHVSEVLGIDVSQVLPLSAQKGLVAKIIGDDNLLALSGLPLLEKALVSRVLPAKHRITRELIRSEISTLLDTTRALLETRIAGYQNQLAELYMLRANKLERGKGLILRAEREKSEFEAGLTEFQSLRGSLARRSNDLFSNLGTDVLDTQMKYALTTMTQSSFTSGMRRAMREYFRELRTKLDNAAVVVVDIHATMEAAYVKYSQDLGLKLGSPPTFSLAKTIRRMERVEQTFKNRFDTVSTMLTYEQMSLTKRFFKTLAAEVRDIYMRANLEATYWVRSVISPIESQVAERQTLVRRHLLAVKRIQDAAEEVNDRIADLEHAVRSLQLQIESLQAIAAEIEFALDSDICPLARAA